MLWRLLQVVYWLVLILDLRCMSLADTTTLKLKTKNNGKIDPFSFEVFPTSREDNFGKFSKDEENFFGQEDTDPDMALFLEDMDFFGDDDNFYQSPFGGRNNTIKDFFSKSLEDSRNKYMEDVNNIDKMFQTPVKSSIEAMLKGEPTHDDVSPKKLNSSERTSVLNENIERHVHDTTKRSVEISKTNGSNSEIPMTNLVNSDNPLIANKTLFLEKHKAAGSHVVAKLVSVKENDAKDVVGNRKDKDENRESRGSDINGELLGPRELKSGNSFIESTNVVTEISVQEMVNGKIVQRKPSSEELRLIEKKMSMQNNSKKAAKQISRETPDYDELEENKKAVNNLSQNYGEETATQEKNLRNEVIDDLSSFLKVDPNFIDESIDKMLTNDEEIRDMDAILNDKEDEYDNSNEEKASRNKESSNNIHTASSSDNKHESQGTDDLSVNRGKENSKSKHSTTNGDREDPQDYRNIFHTEHKNLSNVSDVKIMFSETEGDFFDDDDSEYALNITDKPEVEDETEIAENISNIDGSSKQLKAVVDKLENSNEESVIPEAPSSQNYTDLQGTEIEEVDHNDKVHDKHLDFDEITTVLNNISVLVAESSQVPEHIPDSTEKEVLNNFTETPTSYNKLSKKPAISKEPDSLLNINSNIDKRVSISSQNINETIHLDKSVTDLYEEFDDPIPDIPEVSFTAFNNRQEIDDIDRTMALIKQILAENESSEEKVDAKLQQHSEDVSGLNETVTIPLDISTIPIDSTSSTEGFTEPTHKAIDITTKVFRKDDYSTGQSTDSNTDTLKTEVGVIVDPTEDSIQEISNLSSTESTLTFTTTINTDLNTEVSHNGYNAVEVDNLTPADTSTEINILTTTKVSPAESNYSTKNSSVSYVPDTKHVVVEVVNADAPNIISFKETQVEPHELSSSEVESIYNSKIEEYESLEDSDENGDGWTVFGTKNKEYESKGKKENGLKGKKVMYSSKPSNKNGVEILKDIRIKEILVGDDKQKLVDIESSEDDLVPVLKGTVLNNSAEFSIKISKQDETFYVPSSAHMREYANILNITWETNEYLNNSISLRIYEKENFYMIKEIMINLLTGNEFIKQKKPVAFIPDPVVDDSISGSNRVVMMKDGTYIFFSNVNFLKKIYEPLEYSEASIRERRLWHIEIASICLAVVAIIAVVLYVVAVKTKRKITLREKNELEQVTHC